LDGGKRFAQGKRGDCLVVQTGCFVGPVRAVEVDRTGGELNLRVAL
jgi:hypothetical protein